MENQVAFVRRRLFLPRLKFKNYEELNAYLADRCIVLAKSHPHPEQKERTVFDVFEEERSALMPHRGPFDGFHATTASVSKLAYGLTDGLAAVEAACAEAFSAGIASADVIINALARRQQPQPSPPILTPERLTLSTPPVADCGRYHSLRGAGDTASRSRPSARSEDAYGAL